MDDSERKQKKFTPKREKQQQKQQQQYTNKKNSLLNPGRKFVETKNTKIRNKGASNVYIQHENAVDYSRNTASMDFIGSCCSWRGRRKSRCKTFV